MPRSSSCKKRGKRFATINNLSTKTFYCLYAAAVAVHVAENDVTSTPSHGAFISHTAGLVVPEGAIVCVHYNGYLEYSSEPYDSSRLRSTPMQFILGKGTILGWEKGVSTMRKNELAKFLVRSDYAYGDMGIPPRIPPKATSM